MCVCVNEKMCERSFYVCKCVSACVQVLSSECGCMSVREREKKREGRKRQFLLAGGIFPLIETVEACFS